MSGVDYSTSANRLRELIDEGLITRTERSSHSFKITEYGSSFIEEQYVQIAQLMELVGRQLQHYFGELTVNGKVTGFFFSYGKSHMFRFHPFIRSGETLLLARLPNLALESSDWEPNQIYFTKEVLENTTFLRDIVRAHLKMIDDAESSPLPLV
jgi:hypothetical protein